MMENVAKMAETAQEILFCGDSEYYGKLKSLLMEQAAWKGSYSELLHKCELKLSYSTYMKILAEEGEYALLLEQMKKHTDQIYGYGKLLAGKYSTEICAIFTGQINKEAEDAYGRESYRKCCSRILCFAEAGYKAESIEMIADFIFKYRRKPAFVDELNKIRSC